MKNILSIQINPASTPNTRIPSKNGRSKTKNNPIFNPMIHAKEVSAAAIQAGVKDVQIEKDYVISWVLYGIASDPFLKDNLVFKGGTVLKKAYFPNYRFSEELEFTWKKGELTFEAMKAAFTTLIKWVNARTGMTLVLKGADPGQKANFSFQIGYIGPLGGNGAGKNIKAEVSTQELICFPPVEKEIINTYSDLVNEKYSLLCYTLDEIAAEKMRGLMERTSPKDVYDLWYLFEMDGHVIEDCIFAFQEKARFKKLDPAMLVETASKKFKMFANDWQAHLKHQMKLAPAFHDVWREMEKFWKRFDRFIG